jgi:hypothetical protein
MKAMITISEFIETYKVDRFKVTTLIKNKMHNGLYKALFRPCKGELLRTRIYFDKEKLKVWVKENPEMMHYLTTRAC